MGQVTVYLENDIETKLKTAAKISNLSVSKWVANIIQERMSTEWPQEVVRLAGSWQDDFPSLKEIRSTQGIDTKREAL